MAKATLNLIDLTTDQLPNKILMVTHWTLPLRYLGVLDMVLMAMVQMVPCPDAHVAHEGDGTNKVRASSPGDHPACLQALPPTFTLHTP